MLRPKEIISERRLGGKILRLEEDEDLPTRTLRDGNIKLSYSEHS